MIISSIQQVTNNNASFRGFVPQKKVQEKAFYLTAAFLGLDCAKSWFPTVQKDIFDKQSRKNIDYPREIPRALKHAEAMNEKELFDAKKNVLEKIFAHDVWGKEESIMKSLEAWLINEDSLDATKASSQLIDLILSKECLYNNKNIRDKNFDIAFDCHSKDVVDERKIKNEVLQKYSDSVELQYNSALSFCIGDLVANTDTEAEKNVVELVFDNKDLYSNSNVAEELSLSHFNIPVSDYNSSLRAFIAKKEIAELYINNSNLQNDKRIYNSIGSILSNTDESNDRLVIKILQNKVLRNDDSLMDNIVDILRSSKGKSWFERDNFLDSILDEPSILKKYPVVEILKVLENGQQSNLVSKIVSNDKYQNKAFLMTALPNIIENIETPEDLKLVEMIIEQEEFLKDSKVMFNIASLVNDAKNDEDISYLVTKIIDCKDNKGLLSLINLLKRLTY